LYFKFIAIFTIIPPIFIIFIIILIIINSKIDFHTVVVFFNETSGVVVEVSKNAPYTVGQISCAFNSVKCENTWEVIEGDVSLYKAVVGDIIKRKEREISLLKLAV
jgi:hypothetical protein